MSYIAPSTPRPAGNRPSAATAQRGAGTAALTLLFLIYLGLLVWIILWKLHVPFIGRADMREIKLIPFASTSTYGASAPSEVVANLLIFVPFGLYLGLLVPSWSWVRKTLAVAGASLALEVAQYVLATGSSDVTDVLVNTTGGLLGIGVLALVRRRWGSRTTGVMIGVLVVGTLLALLAVGVFVARMPTMPPPI